MMKAARGVRGVQGVGVGTSNPGFTPVYYRPAIIPAQWYVGIGNSSASCDGGAGSHAIMYNHNLQTHPVTDSCH
jgi:hypothetical protein